MENNNFNTEDTWIDVETLASLKGISKRAVRLSLNNKKYIFKTEKVRGGESYQIKLNSIEPEYQQKYIDDYLKKFYELKNTGFNSNESEPQNKLIPTKQKELALAKYDVVKSWLSFRKTFKKNPFENISADYKFIELFNTGLLHENLFQIVGKISYGTLYRWRNLLSYNADWTSLVGKYNYSSHNEYKTKLVDEYKHIFLKILLSPNSFSIGKAINLTKHILKERGYNNLPKDITFRRFAQWYKSNNFDKWTLARDGYKSLKDKVEPYIVRDISMLEVGQVLIADGHTLNFQVINPFTGRPTRATLLGFLDWKSGGLVGYDIMLEECTQSIMSALRNAILTMNHIPEYIYQDNGRAFKGKFFNGDKKFEELGFTGIYEKLGITPVYATPYNARAKVIERFFREFQESFEKLMPSYIGTSIENKPAYMNRNEKLHKQIHQEKANFIPTIEQALKLIEEWLKFRHSQPCPNNMTKSIQEMLDTIPKQSIDENTLDDLMMAQEVKHIGRNGIRFLKADYFNDELYGIREKAIVKYNLNDLSYIKVYSLKGEFLCRADRVTGTHPLAHQMGDIKDIEDYKQKIKKQGQLRKRTINAVKEHFKLEDVELIKAELIQNEIENQKQIIEIKSIETTLPAKEKPQETFVQNRKRPLFKENYERYEWHMKNGCIGNEDRLWLANYIKSKEYKTIYEE